MYSLTKTRNLSLLQLYPRLFSSSSILNRFTPGKESNLSETCWIPKATFVSTELGGQTWFNRSEPDFVCQHIFDNGFVMVDAPQDREIELRAFNQPPIKRSTTGIIQS